MKLAIRQVGALSSRAEVLFSRARRSRGGVTGPEFRQVQQVKETAPPCAEAQRFAALRQYLGLDLRAAARALGLRSQDIERLEGGTAIPEVVDGWALAEEALRAHAAKLAENHQR